MDDLLEPFLVECRELAAQAARDLAELSRRSDAPEPRDSLFRAVHTLKGSAAMLDFRPMERVMHAAEDVLTEARASAGGLDAACLEPLCEALDQIETWLDQIEASAALPAAAETAADALVEALRGLLLGEAETTRETPAAGARPALEARESGTAFRYTPDPRAYFRGEDPLALARAAPSLLSLELDAVGPWGDLALYDPFRCNLSIKGVCAAPVEAVRAAFRLGGGELELSPAASPSMIEPEPAVGARALAGPRTVRVDWAAVDAVGAAVDELVIAKNALAQVAKVAAAASPADARRVADAQAEVDRLVSRLHAATARLRLAPVGPLFRRFPRVVRELAAELGKAVDFEVGGEEVAVDKTVVDALYEPLLHLLRNALHHGVEPPEGRRAAGKPERARLRLNAYSSGAEATIEVSDDGRGMDADAVRRAAVARGVLSDAAAHALSDDEALGLVFAAGVSTASEVSAVSGRGVGMDAVRSVAEGLGGRVSIASRPGQGATVRLDLPTSAVLTRVMVIEAAGERFGLPLDAVLETARLDPARVTPVRAGRAFVHRDQALPLLRLAEVLALDAPGTGAGELRVVVARAGDGLVGLAVEAFAETIEAPLRPAAGLLSRAPGVLGTLLMSDGRVLIVLDLEELLA